ncbi:MAG: GNAT family N-acetyltransferase [Lachnospiraceae bacterium]|nr:GNAT family N-acetyltransferase [Lachnospiraceae bacterium]
MIKEIAKNDISECVSVIKASFFTVANEMGFNTDNAPRFTAFSITVERLTWQLEKEHRVMCAYYDHGSIIGYYSLLLQENKECELNNLCVLPEYRHRHIGEQLVKDAFEKAKALDRIKMNIGIVEENTVLRHWYERLGFEHIGTKKFDFFPFTCGYMEKDL